MIILSAVSLRCGSAKNRTVGGPSGWNLSTNITQWSASTSFFVNDSLVFLYTPDYDVIEVNKADFSTCRISSPIAAYDDGQTVILLSQAGTRYFVCGRSNHCITGLKLRATILDLPGPPSHNSQPIATGSNSTTGPAQQSPVGGSNNGNHTSHDHHGPPSSNGCGSLGFIISGSYLLHLGISLIAFL